MEKFKVQKIKHKISKIRFELQISNNHKNKKQIHLRRKI